MWTRIGLNLQEEWIEENPEKKRRIITPVGALLEPDRPQLRWGRITSQEEANSVTEALSYSHIFQSYASLNAAASFWLPQADNKTLAGFKKRVEKSMALRVWDAVVHNRWSTSLPQWQRTIERSGSFDWPMWLDIGLFKKYYPINLAPPSMQEFHQWLIQKINKGDIVIGLNVKNGIQIQQWGIAGTAITSPQELSVQQWAGLQPPIIESDVWTNGYIPFSSLSQDVSGYVDPLLNQALHRAHPNATAQQVREILAKDLDLSEEDLSERLSNDQIDAVWLALRQLEKGESFLLGDETGYGKGRILAALSRVALKRNTQILFFTEKKALLSDFYRDSAVLFGNTVPTPTILHSSARVLTPEGNPAFSNKVNRLPQKGDEWVWTTYSQFNRNNADKLQAVTSWVASQPTWILMDEAQNAAGNSNTSKSLKSIQKAAKGMVFSSATFAKNEEQLHAYHRLFKGKKYEWDRLLSAFTNDSDALRAAIALLWAEQGVFLRREHPPMELPLAHWIPLGKDIEIQNKLFSQWWRLMLDCARVWNRGTNKMEGTWGKLGAHLSRASREFSLLQKKDAVIESCVAAVSKDQKPVIVADWTLSSHVARLVNNHKQEEETTETTEENEEIKIAGEGLRFPSCPLWKDSWARLIFDIFPDEDLASITGPVISEMRVAREKIATHLARMPDWSVSPFDDVIQALAKKNIRVLEISGRTWELAEDGGEWVIKNRVQDNRTKIVQMFNSGEAHATLVTRAGNSGISLHAGKLFKDQRQRHMFEWDVAPDPSVRIQFWGRVRRKDQVMEPERSTLLIDTPFERRRLNRDTVKQKKLSSHSGRAANNEISWIGREGTFVAKEWLRFHPHARSVLDPGPDANVEKILTRSVVLSDEERVNLLVHLERGVELFADWNPPRSPVWDKPSRVVRSQWWWGDHHHALSWQERIWEARPTATKEMVFDELRNHAQGKSKTAKEVIEQWKNIWENWWIQQPHQKTKERVQVLNWWLANASTFERSVGVEGTDPQTRGRSRGIVLGWEGPSSTDGGAWGPAQIKVTVWLSSMDRPLSLSLAAWMSPQFGGIKKTPNNPSASWFTGAPTPTKSLVLVGPPWSIAAWGARFSPRGELIHLHNETGGWNWGWKMPEVWDWDHMQSTDRELAGIAHALAFVRQYPQDPMVWRWSPTETMTIHPQSEYLIISGRISALDRVTYPLLKRCYPMQWDDSKTQWFLQLPWKDLKWAFIHWFTSGGIPTVSCKFSQWHAKTWKNFEGK